MSAPGAERSSVPYWLEHRPDRSYDEQDPSTLCHANGSLVCSSDRGFLGIATRLVLAGHRPSYSVLG